MRADACCVYCYFLDIVNMTTYNSIRQHTIVHDTILYLTCSKKLTCSQLSLPHSYVRSRVTVAQGTALAASARAYHLPVGSSCLLMSTQHGTALPHRPAPTDSNVGYRQHLYSSSSAMLNVPFTEHVTIGGRAFSSSLCVEQFAHSSAVF